MITLAVGLWMQGVQLSPLPEARTAAEWRARRTQLLRAWGRMLGEGGPAKPSSSAQTLAEAALPRVIRRHLRYETEPGVWTEAYVLLPRGLGGKAPGVVVFHSTVPHHMRQPAGLEGPADKHIGLRLAEQGFAVICPRCFIFPERGTYDEAVAEMQGRRPGWTGMRKMLWDGMRALDVLAGLPQVDARRLGAAGHSLGAKQALYLAAFDPRVKAAVFSEGGIGIGMSNWEAPWYLGPQVREPGFRRDHHELLALCAPRPFLLIGGDSADGEASRPFLDAARGIYRLLGAEESLGFLNHRRGHEFPPEAMAALLHWLQRALRPAD